MKKLQEELSREHRGLDRIVSRFLVISAALGFLIGIFEASLLWTTPRVAPLLVPDVGYVIWFLAPLVDMIFFALIGLVLGWLASRTAAKEVLIAFEVAIVFTFLILMVRWFHFEVGLHPLRFDAEFVVPLMYFSLAFIVSLVFFALIRHRLVGFAERWAIALVRPLVRGLAVAVIIAVVGIGVFHFQPSFSSTTVRAAPPPSGAPNIVFITLDTVRADHLSSYGYDRPTTPNLDRFARSGVLFENAIAAAPWTLASHASLFTGLLPQQHGADWAVPLSSGPRTLAEILRSWGYETAGFTANFYYMERGWGIARGFQVYNDNSFCLRHNLIQTLIGNAIIQPLYQTFWRYNSFDRRNAKEMNESVFRWYRRRPQRPFFLFINYLDAHDPYVAAAPYSNRYGKAPKGLIRKLRFFMENDASSDNFNVQQSVQLADAYDNCLAYLDNRVGKLLEFLRHTPAWRNTIVIITSDHGEEFGRHRSYGHGWNLYRGALHVPLIIAGPGIPKSVRIRHIVATRELFSTILNFADGGKKPFNRYSLARFWNPTYKSMPTDDEIVSELVPVFDPGARHAMMSLTTPQWEYIEHRNGRQELYRWTVDPHEQDNLAASPQDQATLKKLRLRLIGLVSNAVGPWRGKPYLQALDKVAGSSRLSLLFPKPFQPGAVGNADRIGIVQAYFDTRQSASTRPSRSERDLLKSLPYQ